MTDATTGTSTEQAARTQRGLGFKMPSLDMLKNRGDIVLALGMICILVVLLLPMPTWMLDFSLALSITFSVIILMTVLFIQTPLELNSFPTILLVATMLRLALNLASTRLILAYGHEGTDAAGHFRFPGCDPAEYALAGLGDHGIGTSPWQHFGRFSGGMFDMLICKGNSLPYVASWGKEGHQPLRMLNQYLSNLLP